jgi:hypothetical protein
MNLDPKSLAVPIPEFRNSNLFRILCTGSLKLSTPKSLVSSTSRTSKCQNAEPGNVKMPKWAPKTRRFSRLRGFQRKVPWLLVIRIVELSNPGMSKCRNSTSKGNQWLLLLLIQRSLLLRSSRTLKDTQP